MPSSSDLKNAGLKITIPRIRILEVLSDTQEAHHFSAEEVYKKLLDKNENIGLATVYRVLTQFETAGIVERHNFSDGRAIFELKATTHHDHMVDVDTGQVLEFVNEEIEKLQQKIATEQGYELIDHELVLYVRKTKKS